MAKHGARVITSKCGTVNIVEARGVNVECDAFVVKRSIENAGIGMFNGMSGKTHPQEVPGGYTAPQASVRQDKRSHCDIVLANAAPIMVITGHAADLKEGMAKSADIIDIGRAIKKLKQWVSEQSSDPKTKAEHLDLMIESAHTIS